MITTAQKVCIEALSLPRESRVEIAERILASLEDKADSKADKTWKAVIRRRRAEIRSGKARVRTAEDVMQNALQAIS